jgi:inorganic pyrophosphatase
MTLMISILTFVHCQLSGVRNKWEIIACIFVQCLVLKTLHDFDDLNSHFLDLKMCKVFTFSQTKQCNLCKVFMCLDACKIKKLRKA